MAFEKSLLAGLHLYSKVYYITFTQSLIPYRISLFGLIYFWGLFWPSKLTFSEHWMNSFFAFVSLKNYLSYIFLLDASIFTISDDKKDWKNQFFKYFWRIELKFDEKSLEIHKHKWRSITWAIKTLNSKQTLAENIPEVKLSPVPSE